ncbi:MAG: hypothetical protein LBD41_00095 [Clostridiales Family XIII bacterium]|nr:hypothetical protein [Clostridiales Family XIII bacterium]
MPSISKPIPDKAVNHLPGPIEWTITSGSCERLIISYESKIAGSLQIARAHSHNQEILLQPGVGLIVLELSLSTGPTTISFVNQKGQVSYESELLIPKPRAPRLLLSLQ